MSTTITCRDCCAPHTGRRDAKGCPRCSMLRVLRWHRKKYGNKRCRVCKTAFRPCKPGDLSLCGRCSAASARKKVACGLCKRENGAPDARIPLCFECLKDSDRQLKAIEALERGQTARRAQYCPPQSTEKDA